MGAFWGSDHPFNLSEPLQGEVQTNNRAELQAVIGTLLLEVRPVEVRTDSTYVANGMQRRERQASSKHGNKPVPNADLWQKLADIMAHRPAESVKVTKVKGHSTAEEVMSGAVSAEDKFGNDSADALAVAGAAQSSPADNEGLRKHRAIVFTVRVQRMMLDIAAARGAAERKARQADEESSQASGSFSSSG